MRLSCIQLAAVRLSFVAQLVVGFGGPYLSCHSISDAGAGRRSFACHTAALIEIQVVLHNISVSFEDWSATQFAAHDRYIFSMSSSRALVVRTKRDIAIASQGMTGQEVRSEVLICSCLSRHNIDLYQIRCKMQKSHHEAQARRHANRAGVS